MFVEVVRRYLETLPQEQTGWLAGLRDPAVGRAVALVHENPARGWTIEELARETGVSRSVLAAASCDSSAVHRCNISRDGACNWPRDCSLMGWPRSRRSGVMSATNPKQPSAEALRGSRVSRLLSGATAVADRHRTRKWVPVSGKIRCSSKEIEQQQQFHRFHRCVRCSIATRLHAGSAAILDCDSPVASSKSSCGRLPWSDRCSAHFWSCAPVFASPS